MHFYDKSFNNPPFLTRTSMYFFSRNTYRPQMLWEVFTFSDTPMSPTFVACMGVRTLNKKTEVTFLYGHVPTDVSPFWMCTLAGRLLWECTWPLKYYSRHIYLFFLDWVENTSQVFTAACAHLQRFNRFICPVYLNCKKCKSGRKSQIFGCRKNKCKWIYIES